MSRESKGLNLKNSIAVVNKKSYIRESKKGNSYRIENSRKLFINLTLDMIKYIKINWEWGKKWNRI